MVALLRYAVCMLVLLVSLQLPVLRAFYFSELAIHLSKLCGTVRPCQRTKMANVIPSVSARAIAIVQHSLLIYHHLVSIVGHPRRIIITS